MQLKRCMNAQKALTRVDRILKEHHVTIEADHQELATFRDEAEGCFKQHAARLDEARHALEEVRCALKALTTTERANARRQDAILQLAAKFDSLPLQARQSTTQVVSVPSLLRTDVLLNVSSIDKRSGLFLLIEPISHDDGTIEIRLENRGTEPLEPRQVILQVVVGCNTANGSFEAPADD